MNRIRASSGPESVPQRILPGLWRTTLLILALVPSPAGHAQWLTQSVDLKAGWNAVFLHVDATHRTLSAAVGGDPTNPIQEIWRWNPPAVSQFISSPAEPASTPEWLAWNRAQTESSLQRLTGDTAYLVRVDDSVSTYTWDVKGRPVPPRHSWSVSGLNLVGFPTVSANPPSFATFLAHAPDLQSVSPEIYRYVGGGLGATNPALLASPAFATTPVARGQAFWMRAGTAFNRYFGPFEVLLSNASGIEFGETAGSTSLRLRNLTAEALTVRLTLLASGTAPANTPPIAGDPPLLLRTTLNPADQTYGYTNLATGTSQTWRLQPRDQPGAEVELVLGVNRAAISAAPGALLAGILRFTDSLGHSLIHVPVTAEAGSRAGLWVGEASVSQVAHSLKTFQRGTDDVPVTGPNGSYVAANQDTSFGPVSRPYPLRLIVHNPTNGAPASLLQRVYYGLDAGTNPVVATGESAISPAFLRNARRITAPHLPWTASNVVWAFSGILGQASSLTANVTVSHQEQSANPFLHTYHPDHDNLNASFDAVQPQGAESYRIDRSITLLPQPPGNDFASLVTAGTTLQGEYRETLTLAGHARPGGTNDTRQLQARGTFRLNRITDLPVLTLAP